MTVSLNQQVPVNQPVVSIHDLWQRGLVKVYRTDNLYTARFGGYEWGITPHAYLTLAIRNTPAFWSQEQLQRQGVGDAPGFDRRRFAIAYDLLPDGERTGDEAAILAALNQRRDEFLLLAKLCWRENNLSWRMRLVWFRLWLTERRAGPVARL